MLYIVQRTQIYLEEAQTTELDRRSRAVGRTRSELIRAAIDSYLTEPGDEAQQARHQQAAIMAAFGAEPELGEEVERLRAAGRLRASELAERTTP